MFLFYEGYLSITLNKLRSAFSNHNKFNGSCRAVFKFKNTVKVTLVGGH